MPEGATATDLVLRVVEMLREKGVVGKFVEFYGAGLDYLALEDCATIANMAPEYGATCGFFPVDEDTLRYLRATGREEDRVALVEAYCKAQGLFRSDEAPSFTDTLHLDMSTIKPSLSGPKRPQDRFNLEGSADSFRAMMTKDFEKAPDASNPQPVEGTDYTIDHGDVMIAAITSCTNTSNPPS